MAFFTAKGRLRLRTYFAGAAAFALGVGIYALPTLMPGAMECVEPVAGAGLAVIYYLVVIQALKRLHNLNLSV